MMFLFLTNLAQNQVDSTMMEETAESFSMNIFELAQMGGFIMIVIALLSVIGVYIFFERYFVIKRASKEDTHFMNRIKEYILDGKLDAAHGMCKSVDNPVARMLETGISRIGRPLADVSAAIENVGKLEIYKLEKGLATLATVSGAAPMIGFLGTVIGMIRSFYDMANAGSNIDVSLLSSGIYQAMVTTAAGLIVGIIAYFAYNTLVTRVEKVVFKLEARSTEFMDLLNEPVN